MNRTERIKSVLNEIALEKGAFEFAAIIEREDASGRWDVVVSASWITNDSEFLEFACPRISKVLKDSELIQLGRIAVLDPNGEFLEDYNDLIGPVKKDRDLFNITIAGIPVRHARVFAPQMSLAHE